MDGKIVIRVLDADSRLLGWAAIKGIAKEAALWSPSDSVVVPIDTPGDAVALSYHWCQPNVEVRVPLQDGRPLPVSGELLLDTRTPLIVLGTEAGPLPPVMPREAIRLQVPSGGMGIRDQRFR